MTLQRRAKHLKQWAVSSALPFWARYGVDKHGGFFEDLDLTGNPRAEIVRRFRVQARQVYVFAHASQLGWFDGKPIVNQGFEFMLSQGFERGGNPGFLHLLNADYSVKDSKRDFYDHAFYLLASLWVDKTTQHPRAEPTIRAILNFLDTELKSETGGWLESQPNTLPRRQNPHMHMFEASLIGFKLTGHDFWRQKADAIFELFKHYFYDPNTHTISEFFDEDWKLLQGVKGQTTEPGHAAEWVWLLGLYQRLTGRNTTDYANALYAGLLNSRDVFLNDEEDKAGHVRRATKRLWCQTELIKAHLAQTERGIESAKEMVAASIDGFIETYLNENGTWVDQIDENGHPCATTIPASTFYHIFCMIAEVDRVSRL